MPRHHVQHMQNMGPILFAHNENIAHVMPCVTALHAALIICGAPGNTYGCAIRASWTIFIKNNRLTF